MDTKLRRLFHEVQRQLEIPSNALEQDSDPVSSGILMPQQMDQNYRIELEQLRECLSGVISGKMTLSSCSPYTIRSCFWGIPVLCRAPSVILDPVYMKQQCLEFQEVCGLTGEDIYTEDIWKNQQLHDWARSDQSRLLLIQGGYESVNRLERFAAEVWEYLGSEKPTVAMLQCPASTDFFGGFDERELLRQIALQALRKVTLNQSICSLADMVQLFAEASTCEDWFRILERISQMFPSLIIIMTVTVLGERAESTTTWPTPLEELRASVHKTSLKVLLIATHPLWSVAEAPFLFRVGPAPEIDLDDGMGGIDTPSERHLPLSFPVESRSGQETFETSEKPQGNRILEQQDQHTSIDETPEVRWSELLQQNSFPIQPPQIDIAILCALTLEADAVETLFDEPWTGGYNRSEGDTNTYTFGVIGRRGVVLVHMPGIGTTYSATIAAYCRTTFPRISLALVVGICGGVPFSEDGTELLLGDVVISDGLVRYDFARQYPDGCLIKSSVSESARKLPVEILGYIAKLKGLNARRRLRERANEHLTTLSEVLGVKNPGIEEDILFESTYSHMHHPPSSCTICISNSGDSTGLICERSRSTSCKDLKCDIGRSVARKRQREAALYPAVHFGKFGSGDKVMKSGEDRDSIARSEGIIAFEMEGAGAWDTLPCVIIKGICDYSDSHKDKRWQAYAASTAAACAKAFLEGWRQ
ncbi:pfs domain-containing protein [Fusarium denticulatum]|uniref:Pfs domain-containing protein n=1 Tax=Fusarium denticulatum TaxID=48507 RepID=A0A8H5TDR4_9HYPO|nr:pfs domain-containing protein [Fusarium denticulatum]